MEVKTDYTQEALALLKIGISVIPVSLDGSKLPKISWKQFQKRRMTEEEAIENFKNCGGVIAITGEISQLLCIDFDLDKQAEGDDFWKDFCDNISEELKDKLLINSTRSGGYHIWVRTSYEDKSRKVAHRPLSIPELVVRYNKMIEFGLTEKKASAMLLKKPVECIIETRSRGSYGVFVHEQYTRHSGKKIPKVTEQEVEELLLAAYSLNFDYKKPKPYRVGIDKTKILKQFDEDTTSGDVVEWMESTGLFRYYDTDSNGNHRLAREGSSHPFSAYVYPSGVTYVFGLNPLTDDDKEHITPFEMFCVANQVDANGGIELLKEKYGK